MLRHKEMALRWRRQQQQQLLHFLQIKPAERLAEIRRVPLIKRAGAEAPFARLTEAALLDRRVAGGACGAEHVGDSCKSEVSVE
mmetsp:Transcript_14947/g.56759  ORF Transcript_14947/g.56759 Transcript_14947/m.56759 type:complete len:84 (+) Transcript_14947:1590-1841(+)